MRAVRLYEFLIFNLKKRTLFFLITHSNMFALSFRNCSLFKKNLIAVVQMCENVPSSVSKIKLAYAMCLRSSLDIVANPIKA